MADGVVNIQTKLDQKGVESGLSKLGSAAGTAGKAIAAGFAASAAAVGKLAQKSFEAYGQYEQMVGGVEALYKGSSQAVINYAQEAYKTSQFSTNQYLELATTFSAQLISDLNGDTRKAADVTNEAINAISDNWSVMGGDIELIKKAYSGFARQNYTMLDNLRLGYAGTKGEMKRLVSDANEYAKSIGEAGNLTMDSFADQIHAIELIQRKLGIAGNAQREAAHTIQGSLQMTKAAWQNLLVGLSDKNADLNKLIDQFVDSFDALAENSIPVLEHSLDAIANTIDKLAPKLADRLPGIIERIAPKLVGAAFKISGAVIKALPSIFCAITSAASKDIGASIGVLAGVITANGSKIARAGKSIFDFGKLLGSIPAIANPAALAILGVVAASGAAVIAARAYIDSSKKLPEFTQRLTESISKEHEAWDELIESREKAANTARDNRVVTEELYNSLMRLTDQNGRVGESERALAQDILTQLNEKLGTNYQLTDGVITKDGQLVNMQNELKASVEQTSLEMERQAQIKALQPEYEQALKNRIQYQEDYINALAEEKRAEDELNSLREDFLERSAAGQDTFWLGLKLQAATENVNELKDKLGQAKDNLDNANSALENHDKLVSLAGKSWEEMREGLDGFSQGTEDFAKKSLEQLQSTGEDLRRELENISRTIKEDESNVTDEFLSAKATEWNEYITQLVSKGGEAIEAFRGLEDDQLQVINQMDIAGALKGKAKEAWDAYKVETGVGFDEAGNVIREKSDENAQTAAEGGAKVGSAEAGGLASQKGNVDSAASDIARGVEHVSDNNDNAAAWGDEAGGNFVGALAKWAQDAGHAAADIAQRIADFLHFSRPDKGPLREFDIWPKHFLQQYANKLKENRHLVTDEVELMASDIQAALEDINADFSMGDIAADIRSGARAINAAMNINAEKAQMMLASGEALTPVQGPTLNFYANEYSPDAIYQKFQQADTYGFARRY